MSSAFTLLLLKSSVIFNLNFNIPNENLIDLVFGFIIIIESIGVMSVKNLRESGKFSTIFCFNFPNFLWASLVAQIIKNIRAIQETRVHSLRHEDPLEKGTETQSSLMHGESAWTEEPGRLLSTGSQRVRHD